METIISNWAGIPWNKEFKYLGVNLKFPLRSEIIRELNWTVLVHMIQQQIQTWNQLKLLWFGRVSAVKLKLVPICV